ncbi:hypothetical protein HK104_001550 [Borealophlyctis nickersoniae]|nr:hypothetical protein HK104_001550 [Borealophlyctis nickersoniae]
MQKLAKSPPADRITRVTAVLEDMLLADRQFHPLDYAFITNAYGDQLDYAVAIDLLGKMSISSTPPTVELMTLILRCLADRGNMTDCVQLFEWMKDNQIQPNRITMNTLIAGHAKIGNMEEACALLDEMLQQGGEMQPDVTTFTAIIDGWVRKREMREAELVLKMMRERGVRANVVTMNTLMFGRIAVGDIEGALELFEKMLETGGRIRPSLKTFCGILNPFFRKGPKERLEEIQTILAKVKRFDASVGLGMRSAADLIDRYLRKGDFEAARALLESLQIKGHETVGPQMNLLVRAYVHSGDISSAEILIEKMRSTKQNPPLSAETVTVLVATYLAKNDLPQACKWVGRLGHAGSLLEAMNVVVAGLAKMIDVAGATALIEEMQAVHPNVETYNHLMLGHISRGDVDSAKSIFDRMEGQGVEPDLESYTILMKAYAKTGNIADSTLLMKRYETSGLPPSMDLYSIQARAHFNRLDSARGVEIISKAQSLGLQPTLNTYTSLMSHWFVSKGSLAGTVANFNAIKAAGFTPTPHVYSILLHHHAQCGAVKAFKAYFAEMIAAGQTPHPLHRTYHVLAYCSNGDYNKAASVLEGFERDGVKVTAHAYKYVIEALRKSGNWGRAKEWGEKMRRVGHKVETAWEDKTLIKEENPTKVDLSMVRNAVADGEVATPLSLLRNAVVGGTVETPQSLVRTADAAGKAGTSLSLLRHAVGGGKNVAGS